MKAFLLVAAALAVSARPIAVPPAGVAVDNTNKATGSPLVYVNACENGIEIESAAIVTSPGTCSSGTASGLELLEVKDLETPTASSAMSASPVLSKYQITIDNSQGATHRGIQIRYPSPAGSTVEAGFCIVEGHPADFHPETFDWSATAANGFCHGKEAIEADEVESHPHLEEFQFASTAPAEDFHVCRKLQDVAGSNPESLVGGDDYFLRNGECADAPGAFATYRFQPYTATVADPTTYRNNVKVLNANFVCPAGSSATGTALFTVFRPTATDQEASVISVEITCTGTAGPAMNCALPPSPSDNSLAGADGVEGLRLTILQCVQQGASAAAQSLGEADDDHGVDDGHDHSRRRTRAARALDAVADLGSAFSTTDTTATELASLGAKCTATSRLGSCAAAMSGTAALPAFITGWSDGVRVSSESVADGAGQLIVLYTSNDPAGRARMLNIVKHIRAGFDEEHLGHTDEASEASTDGHDGHGHDRRRGKRSLTAREEDHAAFPTIDPLSSMECRHMHADGDMGACPSNIDAAITTVDVEISGTRSAAYNGVTVETPCVPYDATSYCCTVGDAQTCSGTVTLPATGTTVACQVTRCAPTFGIGSENVNVNFRWFTYTWTVPPEILETPTSRRQATATDLCSALGVTLPTFTEGDASYTTNNRNARIRCADKVSQQISCTADELHGDHPLRKYGFSDDRVYFSTAGASTTTATAAATTVQYDGDLPVGSGPWIVRGCEGSSSKKGLLGLLGLLALIPLIICSLIIGLLVCFCTRTRTKTTNEQPLDNAVGTIIVPSEAPVFQTATSLTTPMPMPSTHVMSYSGGVAGGAPVPFPPNVAPRTF